MSPITITIICIVYYLVSLTMAWLDAPPHKPGSKGEFWMHTFVTLVAGLVWLPLSIIAKLLRFLNK